ncbi:MAG: glycerophosphodiester phosphodiesterase [Chloroflexota bacterium]
MVDLREFASSGEFFVVAHRGASKEAPENTLSAFERALQIGAKMIEADVQVSADGTIFAHHDDVAGRTNDGRGAVTSLNYSDIKKFDAGGWFSPEFSGERPPTLKEIIELIKGRAYLNIEVKPSKYSERLISALLDVVEREGFARNCLFASFDCALLKEIKSRNSALHTAAIKSPADKRLPGEIAQQTGADAFICDVEELTEAISENAVKNSVIIGVYGVETLGSLEKSIRLRAQALGTDDPRRIFRMLEKLGIKSA